MGPSSILIAGVERVASVDVLSITITNHLNELPDSCDFECWGFAPLEYQTVVVVDGANGTVFGGRIQTVSLTVDRVSDGRAAWRVTALDWQWDCDGVLATKGWTNASATTIATELFDAYAPAGFTRTAVAAGLPTLAQFACSLRPLGQAFRELADAIGGDTYVDAAKDLHLFLTETDVTPDTVEAGQVTWKDHLTYSRSIARLTNRVIVGAGGASVIGPVPPGWTFIPVSDGSPFVGASRALVPGLIVSYSSVVTGALITAPTIAGWTVSLFPGVAGFVPTHGHHYSFTLTLKTARGETVASNWSNAIAYTSGNAIVVSWGNIAAQIPPTVQKLVLYMHDDDAGVTYRAKDFNPYETGTDSNQFTGIAVGSPPAATAAGSEAITGGSLSGAISQGATAIAVTAQNTANWVGFNWGPGVAVINYHDNLIPILYSGRSGNSGTVNLTGIPASGVGSIPYAVPSGASIQNVPALRGVPASGDGSIPATMTIAHGARIQAIVQRDDASSQSTYGVRARFFSDPALTPAGASAYGDAQLTLYKAAVLSGSYVTSDPKVRAGRRVTVNLAAPVSISLTRTIQSVAIRWVKDRPYGQRTVTFGQVPEQSLYRVLRGIYRDLGLSPGG